MCPSHSHALATRHDPRPYSVTAKIGEGGMGEAVRGGRRQTDESGQISRKRGCKPAALRHPAR